MKVVVYLLPLGTTKRKIRGGMDLYFYDDLIELRPEEDETGNKIADNVLYNEILDALKGLDDYQGFEAEPFDRLKEEAAKNRKEK